MYGQITVSDEEENMRSRNFLDGIYYEDDDEEYEEESNDSEEDE